MSAFTSSFEQTLYFIYMKSAPPPPVYMSSIKCSRLIRPLARTGEITIKIWEARLPAVILIVPPHDFQFWRRYFHIIFLRAAPSSATLNHFLAKHILQLIIEIVSTMFTPNAANIFRARIIFARTQVFSPINAKADFSGLSQGNFFRSFNFEKQTPLN
jgi:hypothetical protein